jgi:galactose-1-phosphate uridylyltransferase
VLVELGMLEQRHKGDSGEVTVIAEDVCWVAFFPLNPATPGHTLVIPSQHVSDLWALEPAATSPLMAGVVRVGRAIQAVLNPEGMNLIASSGEAAEQSMCTNGMAACPSPHPRERPTRRPTYVPPAVHSRLVQRQRTAT